MSELTREEYLAELDKINQTNPMLLELAFSILKLNELEIITDEQRDLYLKELDQKKDLLLQ